MKALLALAVVLSGFAAHAGSDDLAAQALETLIENSAKVKLVHSDGSASDQTLAQILAEGLAADTLVAVGKPAFLRSVSAECTNVTPSGLLGSTHLECVLQINDGTYIRTKTGYRGPETESSRILRFKAMKAVYPGAKLKLSGDTVSVDFAG